MTIQDSSLRSHGNATSRTLTRQPDGRIDVALVKEFYANLYDPEDKSLRQVRVRGKLIKFNGSH